MMPLAKTNARLYLDIGMIIFAFVAGMLVGWGVL